MGLVIGLCGYKGSGKSEVAKYIADNYRFKRVNFKDALVSEIKERFPDLIVEIINTMDKIAYSGSEWTYDRLIMEKPPLMRTLLQNYGTEVRRSDNQNYWTEKWASKVRDVEGNIVTDDVRFLNEASILKSKGGILIRVVREDITHGGDHPSEKENELFDTDFTIVARLGDISAAFRQVDSIMATISRD